MGHAAEALSSVPARVTWTPPEAAAATGKLRAGRPRPNDIRLLVKGQGTIGFAIADKAAFSITFAARPNDSGAAHAFRWSVDEKSVTLHEQRDGDWVALAIKADDQCGLDPDPRLVCVYWFSFDAHNRALRYGKGEMRLGCEHAYCELPARPVPDEETHITPPDSYSWLGQIDTVDVAAPIKGDLDIWRDPVVVDPAMYVVRHDEITMDDMAHGMVTVPANLSPTCQQLYDNVAGKAFVLDPPGGGGASGFSFAEAVKRSIADKRGWCFRKLVEKANEFGKPDPHKTYLRITMGQNQGDSPGIPFVMEIWPVGNYSPVHNHGGSDAVIKVLHGAITVDLFPTLSRFAVPFASKTFVKDDVTWISARLNQVHRLKNNGKDEPCITIQCYMYAAGNDTHWGYFDYIDEDRIGHFDPNSDADFLEFRSIMRQEWNDWYRLE